jgi:Flp pilus assembly pilin Flp
MLFSLWETSPHPLETNEESSVHKRRGTTSLEYMAVISLILVVVILAVQHLGVATGGLFTDDAKATSATLQTGP